MKHEPLLMGIDIGTSACKAALFRLDGTVAACAVRTYPTHHPAPGYAEQDCADWWGAVCAAAAQCLASVDPADVAGIGVDGQSWSCIPVDGQGRALHRTPIWMDMRCADLCAQVTQSLGADTIFHVAKNPFQPSYTTPKILWFRRHRPDIYEKTAYFLQSNSYIVLRLTGRVTQDKSQSYGLHVYDMAKGCYDPGLCKALDIDPARLPPIFACHQVVGRVTRRAAEETGLAPGTPVVAGGLDAACGALGAGVCRPGQTQEQGGQAGGMGICVEKPLGDPRLILSSHVVPELWLLQGGTVAGGAAYGWIAGAIGRAEEEAALRAGRRPMALMDELAAEVGPGSDGLLFLPYLAGERSPIWDANASGMFFGLTFGKGRGHFYRAVMEGAAYALRHNLQVARQAGVHAASLNAMGGAAGSPVWMQIKADVTGTPLCVPRSDTATPLGAAILAGVGTGLYAGFDEAVAATIRVERTYQPDPANTAVYDRYFQLYLDLYRANKDLMRRQRAILDAGIP